MASVLSSAGNTLRVLALIPRTLLKSPFFRNLFTVMFGTVAAQAISFALVPVLGRIFSPSDFGIFGGFSAVLGVFAAASTLQYTQALMLPKEDSEAWLLFLLSCFSAVGVAVLCGATSLLFPTFMTTVLNASGMKWVLWVLPIAVLFNGVSQAMQALCIRHKAFRTTSGSQAVRSIAAGGSQVALGLSGAGGGGLISGSILGDLASSLSLWSGIRQAGAGKSLTGWEWSQLWKAAREYGDFAIYATPQNLMNAASQGLPVLLLGQYFGAAVAGYYAFGVRVLQAPMSLVLTPLRQVLFQRLSEAHNDGLKLFPLHCKFTAGLVAAAALPLAVGFIWAPQLFEFVLGKEWLEAGSYARWLLLWLGVLFCNAPSVLLGRILRQQRNLLLFDALLLCGRTAALITGGLFFDPMKTIILFSIVGLIANGGIIVWIGWLAARSDREASSK